MTSTMSFARRLMTAAALVAAVAAAPAAAQRSADGNDRRILIENQASQAIVYVRGSPVAASSFGADRIPERTLGHGDSAVVDFDNGSGDCMYDLRATLADGSHVDRMNVNVCQASQWRIGDRTNNIR